MLRISLIVSALLFGALSVAANTYYSLELESARLIPKGLNEDNRPYDVTREGGGIAPRITYDASAGSKVLVLETTSTPEAALKDRAEMRIFSGVTFDRTLFLGMRVKYSGQVDPEAWHLFAQCHQAGTGKSPPLSLNLLPGGQMALVSRSTEDSYERLWSGPMQAGRWHDVVIGFRMGEKGHVRLWLNGRKLADERLPLRWKGHAERCVLKTGIYRAASDAPFQMRLDDIRLGDRYIDVAR